MATLDELDEISEEVDADVAEFNPPQTGGNGAVQGTNGYTPPWWPPELGAFPQKWGGSSWDPEKMPDWGAALKILNQFSGDEYVGPSYEELQAWLSQYPEEAARFNINPYQGDPSKGFTLTEKGTDQLPDKSPGMWTHPETGQTWINPEGYEAPSWQDQLHNLVMTGQLDKAFALNEIQRQFDDDRMSEQELAMRASSLASTPQEYTSWMDAMRSGRPSLDAWRDQFEIAPDKATVDGQVVQPQISPGIGPDTGSQEGGPPTYVPDIDTNEYVQPGTDTMPIIPAGPGDDVGSAIQGYIPSVDEEIETYPTGVLPIRNPNLPPSVRPGTGYSEAFPAGRGVLPSGYNPGMLAPDVPISNRPSVRPGAGYDQAVYRDDPRNQFRPVPYVDPNAPSMHPIPLEEPYFRANPDGSFSRYLVNRTTTPAGYGVPEIIPTASLRKFQKVMPGIMDDYRMMTNTRDWRTPGDVADLAKGGLQSLGEAIAGALKRGQENIPSYASGGVVQNTGLANVHKNEIIFTPEGEIIDDNPYSLPPNEYQAAVQGQPPEQVEAAVQAEAPVLPAPDYRKYVGPLNMAGKMANRGGGGQPRSVQATSPGVTDEELMNYPLGMTGDIFRAPTGVGLSGGGALYAGSQDVPYASTEERLRILAAKYGWTLAEAAAYDMAQRERRMGLQQGFIRRGGKRIQYL